MATNGCFTSIRKHMFPVNRNNPLKLYKKPLSLLKTKGESLYHHRLE